MKQHKLNYLYKNIDIYFRCQKCELTCFSSEEVFKNIMAGPNSHYVIVNKFVHIHTDKGVVKCEPNNINIDYNSIIECKYTDEEFVAKQIIE